METKLAAVSTPALHLTGHVNNAPQLETSTRKANFISSQPYRVTNGFYRSGIVVTDNEGTITANITVRLRTDLRTLSYCEDSTGSPSGTSGKITTYAYDRQGNWTSSSVVQNAAIVSSRNHYYDSNGLLIDATFLDTSNSLWMESFNYNETGQLTSIRRRPLGEASTCGREDKIFNYDNNGRLESTVTVSPRASDRSNITYYFYNDANQLIETQFHSESDKTLNNRLEYNYDSDGNVSKITSFSADGEMSSVTEYSYTATDEFIFNQTLFEILYSPS